MPDGCKINHTKDSLYEINKIRKLLEFLACRLKKVYYLQLEAAINAFLKEGLMKKSEPASFISSYLDELVEAHVNFPIDSVIKLSSLIRGMHETGMLYTIGNGGSASTASHMATDLGVGSLRRKNPVRCISLVDNPAVLTATSNDLDFSKIFSQQIKLLGKNGDLLICFSASGNSRNLLEAVEVAKNIGIITVGITGFDGGSLKDVCDLSVHTPTRLGSYGVVEDLHSSVSHILTEMIRNS